ncbi:MAG: hypothetical protein IPH77_14605 [Ignavibacteria bacterium]|nr:hypothetical protein [Ignavibacteria bacterium]
MTIRIFTRYSTVNSTPANGMFWGRYVDLSTTSGCATTSWTSSTAPPGRGIPDLLGPFASASEKRQRFYRVHFDLKQNYRIRSIL